LDGSAVGLLEGSADGAKLGAREGENDGLPGGTDAGSRLCDSEGLIDEATPGLLLGLLEIWPSVGTLLRIPDGLEVGPLVEFAEGDCIDVEFGARAGPWLGTELVLVLGPCPGADDGTELGPIDGDSPGRELGRALGELVGNNDGLEDGFLLGAQLGDEFGTMLGLSVGKLLCCNDTPALGIWLALLLGLFDAKLVGTTDGGCRLGMPLSLIDGSSLVG
jgi:hypothetical protein